uniref:Uncharacterized protein n=1 Tax=Romanomermis culicivorax TaxID=13658 RepID=A0A915LB68_ROMCU
MKQLFCSKREILPIYLILPRSKDVSFFMMPVHVPAIQAVNKRCRLSSLLYIFLVFALTASFCFPNTALD